MFHSRALLRSLPVPALVVLALASKDFAATCPASTPLSTGTTTCANASGKKQGDYTWSLWAATQGCITPHEQDATFRAAWTDSRLSVSMGLQWDETKTYDKYGVVYADFAETKTGLAGQYSGIGISGWSNSPLVQYYIMDDWFSSSWRGGTLVGTYSLDDGTYQLYKTAMSKQPTIHGTQEFVQYLSVRNARRECGRISVSEHWKRWEELGLHLGLMYNAGFQVESDGGTGSVDFTRAVLVANANASVRTVHPSVTSSGVSMGGGQEGRILLVGLDGKVLRSASQTPSNPADLSISGLPKGVYLLRFQADGEAPLSAKILLQ